MKNKQYVPIWHGHIGDDGRFQLLVAEQPKRQEYFKSLAGCDVDITVRKHRSQRSLDQNAYWHGIPFPLLQDALGYDSIEELKYDLMGACWGWMRSKAGHEIPIKPSTSSMDTEEGAQFTEWLIRFGATLPTPVIIPLPNEVMAA